MDWLRSCYKTQMRMVVGGPTVEVRWFKCDKKAPINRMRNGFGSIIWENDWRLKKDQGKAGEVYGTERVWYNGQPGSGDRCFKGPLWPEAYRRGVPSQEANTYPVLKTDSSGFPVGCCSAVEYWYLYDQCSHLIRLPQKVRVHQVNTSYLTGCSQSFGTDLILHRQGD